MIHGSMPRISGKRAFLELLRQEGVDILFGNPGTTELPLMDAFAAGHDVRYVLALQEAAAMAMADGYAQASQRLAVVNLHVAPGLGNARGLLYEPQKGATPVLVPAGQHDQGFNITEPILWADLPTLARPLVKWSAEVHRLADLPRMVHRAAKTALAQGRVGLVAPLVAVYPLFTLAFAALLLRRETLHLRLVAGIALTVAGVAVTVAS